MKKVKCSMTGCNSITTKGVVFSFELLVECLGSLDIEDVYLYVDAENKKLRIRGSEESRDDLISKAT